MDGNVINYFGDGNTAKGYVSLHESNFDGLNEIFILNGQSASVKSEILKNFSIEYADRGFKIELIRSSLDKDYVNGLIISYLNIGFLDGNLLGEFEPKWPETLPMYIDLDVSLDKIAITRINEEITKAINEKEQNYKKAISKFGEALKIHDEWEKIYIKNLKISKANELTKKLESIIFNNRNFKNYGVKKERFFGALTYEGSVDYINELTEDIEKRYFIKGKPGTGKSTLLKKLSQKAVDTGVNVEVYRCGFDPDSFDMIIFRQLGIAIFDSTHPHEHFPVRPNDEIIDMYEKVVKSSTEENFKLELEEIKSRYNLKISSGIEYLKKAKLANDIIENYYINVTDFSKVEEIKSRIKNELEEKLK